jgi:hypothetical protein
MHSSFVLYCLALNLRYIESIPKILAYQPMISGWGYAKGSENRGKIAAFHSSLSGRQFRGDIEDQVDDGVPIILSLSFDGGNGHWTDAEQYWSDNR